MESPQGTHGTGGLPGLMTTPDPHDPGPHPQLHPAAQPHPVAQPQPYAVEPQYPYYHGYGYQPYWQPAAPPPRRRRRGLIAAGAAAAVLAAGTVTGIALTSGGGGALAGSGTSLLPSDQGGTSGGSGTGGSGTGGSGTGGSGTGGSGTGGNGTTSVGLATAKQAKGVVTIVSVLKYQNAESAGTGMILSANGEILTNNHVVNGATSITVTVETTGKSYRADVVGTAPTKDVAVLQLRNASGLQTANVGDSHDVKAGDSITGVGNAGGTGTLRASAGKVTALNQTITASDENGSSSERLHGLIGVDADIISGDSGGPLYDAAGAIVGMNTAASQSQGGRGSVSSGGTSTSAYAIAIDDAETVARQIESGRASSTVHLGLPPFIGVGVTDADGRGAGITSVLDGGPAADAGISAGSVVTAVGGTRVTDAASLKAALARHAAGDTVTLHWNDQSGAAHSATVRTITGPAD